MAPKIGIGQTDLGCGEGGGGVQCDPSQWSGKNLGRTFCLAIDIIFPPFTLCALFS